MSEASELQQATTRAVDALAYRLKNRDPDVADELFALEFMMALRGQGWRPTAARAPEWKAARSGPHASEEAKAAFREELERQHWYRNMHPELDQGD